MGNHQQSGAAPMVVTEPPQEELSAYDGGQHWSERPDVEMPIHFPRKGPCSKELMPAMTVVELLQQAAKKRGSKNALLQEPPNKVGLGKDKKWPPPLPRAEWRTWTWQKYYDDVRKFAKAALKVGFEQHDAATIFGGNAPEWLISGLGTMMAGGKCSGVYPSDTPEQFQYKAHHSRSSIVVVENEAIFKMVESVANDIPYCRAVVIWGGPAPKAEIARSGGDAIKVYTFEEFMDLGGKQPDAEVDARIAKIKPGHVCSLIYTSGTTGAPKAVMITHDNIVYEAKVVMTMGITAVGANPDDEERILSYLPLSHVAGQMVDVICPVVVSAIRPGYCTVFFARPYDLKVGSIGERLRDVKPTIFLGVPRVWEKIAEKIKAVGARVTGFKKKIATWAKAKGLAYQENLQLGGSGARPSMYDLADKIVLSKVKANLGLSEMKFGFTGAAPIAVETLEYFGSLGININEVYGMSECTGATTWSTDGAHTWGSVGYALSGMEVRIFKVAEGEKTECPRTKDLHGPQPDECKGEICMRGRHIMAGYLANPAMGEAHVEEIKKKNREAIDSHGWLHSGDMGVKDMRGMIKIVGRFKELIIGAGGENIAPVPIEDEIKKNGEGVIANVQMIGDRRKFNTLLVTLTCKGATGEKAGTDELDGAAAGLVPGVNTIAQAAASEQFLEFIEEAIKDANNNGQVCPSNASKIGKFTILPIDFSVEGDELTSTFKLKRSVVEKKYAAAIDAMYATEGGKMFVPFVG